MTEEQNIALRQEAIFQAIKANTGNTYDDEGRLIVNADKIVEAAKKFETYLKGSTNVNESL